MAQIQKAIITDYPDGSRVMSNIINKKGVPVFKENDTYTATRVTTWYDGTPMDDSKADGKVYLKHISSGDYYRVNLPNDGELFLEKDTVAQLRDMNAVEILLLRMGYYKGVTLQGYYSEGDTPAPIQYYLSDTEEEDDGGSVFEVGGIKLEHEFVGEVDWLYFGASPELINNVGILNRVCQYAIINSACVYLNATQVFDFNIDVSDLTVKINSSFSVRSNSSCLLNLTGSSTTSTLFSITDDVNIKSVINITDIRTKGVKRVRFIGKEISGNSSFPKIGALNLNNLRLGTHSIAINFHVDKLLLSDIKGGLGLSDTDTSSFYLSISPDSSQGVINSYLHIENVYGYGAMEDLDMFFIKGGNYKSISLTNCTSEWLTLIPSRSGDGFDLDGIGERAFINNIRAINCGIEIKYSGVTGLNSNYNLIGNNIISTRGSVSLRCSGTFSNVISDRPVTTGLIIAGYSGSQDLNTSYLTVNNASVLFDSTAHSAAAPVTIAMPNISIKGLTLMPHIDDPNALAPAGLRISSCKNVSIDGLLIKNTPQITTTPASQIIDNLSIRNVTAINIRDRGFDFGESTNLSNSNFSNLSIQDYQGGYNNLFQIRTTQVLTNVKINDFPYSWYGSFKGLPNFKLFCQHFLIDGQGWDTTDNTGLPIISTTWGVGTIVQKAVDNSFWARISSSSTPSSAYKKINTETATPSLAGVVKQSAASSDTATQSAGATPTKAEFDALLAELRDLKTKMRAGDAPILSS